MNFDFLFTGKGKQIHSLKYMHVVLLCLIIFTGSMASAVDESETVTELKRVLSEFIPDLEVTRVNRAPVEGFFEIVSAGQIYYVSADGQYIFNGALIETTTGKNLTAEQRNKIHHQLINQMGEEDMLIYEPEKEAIGSITVFTDTSCPYCSKLHEEIDTLLQNDIRVRYLLYPRAGPNSQAYRDLQNVWCAKDPHTAMTIAKKGGVIETASCDNPIAAHIKLAGNVGLRGTPLIYLSNGDVIPGYRPANELVTMIRQDMQID